MPSRPSDPRDARIGQLWMAGQDLKEKLDEAYHVLAQIQQGELAIEQVVLLPDGGLAIMPKPPDVVESEGGQ